MIQLQAPSRPSEAPYGKVDPADLLMAASELRAEGRLAMLPRPEAGMVPGMRTLPDAGGAAGPMARPGTFMSDPEKTYKQRLKEQGEEWLKKLQDAFEPLGKGH